METSSFITEVFSLFESSPRVRGYRPVMSEDLEGADIPTVQ